jgi:hypothetical protein
MSDFGNGNAPDTAVNADSVPAADGDELSKLLAEFDGSTAGNPGVDRESDLPSVTPPPAAPAPQPDTNQNSGIEHRLNEIHRQISYEASQRDYDAAVQAIRGDADAELFSDGLMNTWIEHEARSDMRLATAWVNRKADPQTYRRAIDKLARKFNAEVVKRAPDRQATEDREAVTQAVRGASTKAPAGQAPNYAGMSDAEFREAHKREYGYSPKI